MKFFELNFIFILIYSKLKDTELLKNNCETLHTLHKVHLFRNNSKIIIVQRIIFYRFKLENFVGNSIYFDINKLHAAVIPSANLFKRSKPDHVERVFWMCNTIKS